jgi:hypothetical protein
MRWRDIAIEPPPRNQVLLVYQPDCIEYPSKERGKFQYRRGRAYTAMLAKWYGRWRWMTVPVNRRDWTLDDIRGVREGRGVLEPIGPTHWMYLPEEPSREEWLEARKRFWKIKD